MKPSSRYEMLEKLGTGAFATVYRARDNELKREVAIKQIHEQYLADPAQLERYWEEAQLLASFQHPNIITVYDIVRDRGWLVTELMQANLSERMDGRPMDLRSLRTTVAHCLRALKYLHARGIVHGDIKPTNLMIDARRRIKIGDFGLARRVSDDEGSLLKGTTKYMAPEVVSDEFGDVGPASDLYSLGFSSYELMCGDNFETLFPGLSAFGRNQQVAWMMWQAAPDRKLPRIARVLQGVPEDLAHVIETLTEKDQSKRYRAADEALVDLKVDQKAAQSPSKPEASKSDDTESAAPEDKKRRMIAISAFCASLLLSAIALFLPSGDSVAPDDAESTILAVVTDVYADRNQIRIEDLQDGIPDILDVGDRPRIFLTNEDKNILVQELLPGDRLEIEKSLNEAGEATITITASRPVVSSGRVREINLPDRQVVIAIDEGESRDDVPLSVPEQAKLVLNGVQTLELREVEPGDDVEVQHVEAPGGSKRAITELRIRRMTEMTGFLESLNVSENELTLGYGLSDDAEATTLKIAEDCRVQLRNMADGNIEEIPVDDLALGDRLVIFYDTEIREITVTRDQINTSGVLDEVQVANEMFVVSTPDGQRLSMSATPLTDIRINNIKVELQDLRRFDNVDVSYSRSNGDSYLAAGVNANRPERNDRWSIVIGNQTFQDRFLSPVPYATRNVNDFAGILEDRYACKNERMLVLIDGDKSTVTQQFTDMLDQVRSQTELVVYVCTQGYADSQGRVYLAASDFNWDQMEQSGIPLEWFVEQLEQCSSNTKTFLFDCNHSGSGQDLDRQPSAEDMLQSVATSLKTTVAIGNSQRNQRGQRLPDERVGLFARAIIDAYSGRADEDRDLHITAEELFPYLQSRMNSLASEAAVSQAPARFGPN